MSHSPTAFENLQINEIEQGSFETQNVNVESEHKLSRWSGEIESPQNNQKYKTAEKYGP